LGASDEEGVDGGGRGGVGGGRGWKVVNLTSQRERERERERSKRKKKMEEKEERGSEKSTNKACDAHTQRVGCT
jgi:hypothetical protein